MRVEPAWPGLQSMAPAQYNQLSTMHGTIMLLFCATAGGVHSRNDVLPLQIGATEMAFPRLNALSTADRGAPAPHPAAAAGNRVQPARGSSELPRRIRTRHPPKPRAATGTVLPQVRRFPAPRTGSHPARGATT